MGRTVKLPHSQIQFAEVFVAAFDLQRYVEKKIDTLQLGEHFRLAARAYNQQDVSALGYHYGQIRRILSEPLREWVADSNNDIAKPRVGDVHKPVVISVRSR
jgi:hypothetical protein